MFSLRRIIYFLVASLLIAIQSTPIIWAAASTNYQVNEYFFGGGGQLNSCSTNYCTKQALGELGVGNTASLNYQAQAGFNTNRTPYIQFIVNTSSVNLGTLSASSTATGTATFSVKTYLASGYIVQTMSSPPTNGAHIVATPSSPTASAVGTEQFGMNLVSNQTSCTPAAPANFGANPVQVPGASFSYGAAAANYNTCGLFKYGVGDTIASSSRSSGETDYTISYIFNISNLTPGGTYSMNQVLVATSTY